MPASSAAPPARPPVWAAVVCFRARPGAVAALVERLRPQVQHILLLDNAPRSDPGLPELAGPGVSYLPLPANLGTGAALNHAWRLALQAQAQALIGFDQDSLPAPAMVSHLIATWQALQTRGRPVAAVGPACVDQRSDRLSPVLEPVGWRRRTRLPVGPEPILVDHLITSGCLVPAAIQQRVGDLDEGLFLDYTDIEWSLRARAVGLELYVEPRAIMAHAIGDDLVRLGLRDVPRHSPQRAYLQVRNHLLLWRSAAPRRWLLHDLLRQSAKHLLLVLRGPQRRQRLAWVLRGLAHGLGGRSGPPPSSLQP